MKKVQVLLGPHNEVLATFERTPNAYVACEPEVEEGCRIEEIDAQDDYMEDVKTFHEECAIKARTK